ncbi:MAG: dihydroorotate dehydrogenase electron transfer subunit [Nitrospirota bacterium]
MMIARIKRNEELFSGYFLVDMEAEGIGLHEAGLPARPGQFYMIKVGPSTDPLLRRPLSLHRRLGDDSVRFLYRQAGRGTALLSRLIAGDEVDVLGPLGNGFPIPAGVKHALIVGGGIGIAPLMALADYISDARKDVTAAAFIGGRSREYVLGVDEFREKGIETFTATEDGSLPKKGLITHVLDEYILEHKHKGTGGWIIYSCGPKPMLMSVAALAIKHGIKNYTSMESGMACGIGACMGCVISVLDRERGSAVYKKVCDDGPVFDADDVIWAQI